jgi:hypothetical protein
MTTKKLLGLFPLLGSVTIHRWSTVMQIADSISKGETTIGSKAWADNWHHNHKNKSPEYYHLDLSDTHTWSTHDNYDCITLEFSVENKKLVCAVEIYDGNIVDGRREQLRFTAELIMPDNFAKNIEQSILYSFDRFLEDEYERHLENQKREWIAALRNEIIRNKSNK